MSDTAEISHWRDVQRLFDAALERPETERTTFIEEQAGSEEVASAVRRLLAVHDDYRATADLVRGPVAVALTVRALAQEQQLAPATRVGAYRIESLLGSGGMGSVYLATRDVGGRPQHVALKIVPPALRHERVMEQLRRERAILAGLDHPNVARLIDAGELPDGRPFFAMEYVDGVRITDYCDERGLALPARLALFATVCDAVAYAHRRFVLHRDLKPGNILVDRDGRVRLLDFGIAKVIDGVAATDATVDGNFFSPDCAAPEQVAGEPTSIATDVYGLGCLLYELLCGSGPFDFSGRSRTGIIEAILREEPQPPSRSVARSSGAWAQRGHANAAALSAALRGDLDLIVGKALRKPPADRYETVDAFADDVRRVLAARPIALRGRDRGYRLRCFVRRHRVAVAAMLLAGVVAIAAVGMTIAQSRRVAAARAVAESERDHARGVTEFLVNAFGDENPFRARKREVKASELLQNAARALARVSADDAALTAALAQTLAQLYLRLDLREQAKAQAALAAAAMARLPDVATPLRTRQLTLDAELAVDDARYRDAFAAVDHALGLMAADPSFKDAEIEVRLALVKGQALRLSTSPMASVDHLRHSIQALRDRPDVPPARLEYMQQVLARQLSLNGNPAEGLALTSELLVRQHQRGLTDDDAIVIDTLRSMGQAYYRLRRNDDAIEVYERAIAAFRRSYGNSYSELANMLHQLGVLYGEIDRAPEGERLLREAVRISHELNVPRRNLSVTYDQLAILYRDSYHDYAAALRYSGLSFALAPAEARDIRAYSSRALAETLIANGDWFEAMLHAESALPYMIDYCRDCQQVAYLRGDIAYARYRLYDLDGAREWLTTDTLTTLRVWSRWPHNVRLRAEEINRAMGTSERPQRDGQPASNQRRGGADS